jgi:penicillin amidase
MEKREETIQVAGAPSRKVTIYRTSQGPVITKVRPGIEAVVTLKWYGTLAEGEMEETTFNGLNSLMRSRSVNQVIGAGRRIAVIGQNIVCADTEGHIGWIATGRIPKRRGYSGRLPADGSCGRQYWDGFVPAEENPFRIDPDSGWIVTANHRTVDDSYPHRITYNWCPRYRHDRIVEMLRGSGDFTVQAFQEMQRDVHSRQAEKILPGVLRRSYADPLAKEAVALLEGWDYRLTADSRAGLVFQVFCHAFIEILTEDLLADALPIYLSIAQWFHSAAEVYLDPEREPATELLAGRNLDQVCEQSLARAIRYLEAALGRNRAGWRWGALHRYCYEHPGAKGFLPTWLLNRGPYPAAGSTFTVNMASYNLAKKGGALRQYTVTTIPSLRMVTSLADLDRTFIMGPLGQSGRPGHPHYADMIEPWIRGQAVLLPLSRDGAERIAVSRTFLS